MSKSSKKAVCITMGDPRGIGPEVIVKALADKKLLAQGRFMVVGDKKALKRLSPQVDIIDLPYRAAGEGSLKFLDKAIELIKLDRAQALVTAPIAKEAVNAYAKGFVGHTEYLARAFKVKHFDMMFVAGNVRLSIATRHVPLKDVPALITSKLVFDSIALMDLTLKEKFGIERPSIAVLGLNPHAGEAGLLGKEDLKSIVPAIRRAQSRGINAAGPLPADTFFAFHKPFDGIVAMYHDQGLAPMKGMYMGQLVNFTAGLPFVRTCPAHGTAFDIAGQNKADPSSMISAIKLACQLA